MLAKLLSINKTILSTTFVECYRKDDKNKIIIIIIIINKAIYRFL